MSGESAVEIDDALQRFEHAWKVGKTPDLRGVVEGLSEPLASSTSRPQLICELLMIDFWHRWRSGAQAAAAPTVSVQSLDTAVSDGWPRFPRLDDYAKRYADLLDWTDPPAELIGEEYRVRRWFGEQPTHDEYLRRFPSKSELLASVMTRIDAQATPGAATKTLPLANSPVQARSAAAPPEVTKIGKYQILAPLDEGGQGRVFRAMHPELRQELAIKLGHPAEGQGEKERNALIAEARVLAQLEHPNLIRVHDLGFHEGCPYVVLDYVPGRNLREVARSQQIAPERAAEIVAKIARAVAIAHAHGVTHLDLKPGNILIDQHGQPRLIDFGLARQRSMWTSPDESKARIAGTFLYMAPEQARGDAAQIGGRTDVYGLGGVLYDLLVGHPPRHGESMADIMNQAEEGVFDVESLNAVKIPPGLARICSKALAAKPADRHESADRLADAIETWQESEAASRSRRKLGIVAAAILLGTMLVGAFLLQVNQPPIRPEVRAAAVVGHVPRHDFPLEFEIVGQKEREIATLHDGQAIAVRLASDVDCYVGVWHVDSEKKATLLFPNDQEQDHFLRAGQSLTVPGRDDYSITVSKSKGTEYLWVVAITQPWDAAVGQERGPAIVLLDATELVQKKERAANIVARTVPRASERVIQLNVRTAK